MTEIQKELLAIEPTDRGVIAGQPVWRTSRGTWYIQGNYYSTLPAAVAAITGKTEKD